MTKKIDFRRIKRLHAEFNFELGRVSEALCTQFGNDMWVAPTSDGLCVMFEDRDATGVAIEDFEKMIASPNFDLSHIQTYL